MQQINVVNGYDVFQCIGSRVVIMITIINIISILSVSFISAVPLQTEDEVMEHRSETGSKFDLSQL